MRLYVTSADGKQPIRIITTPGNADDYSPAWGAQNWIAFAQKDRNFHQSVWIVNPQTDDTKAVSVPGGDAISPAWSPDGRTLAYQQQTSSQHWNIMLYDLKSGQSTQLTHDEGDNTVPVWSPSGTFIAFHSTRGGQPDLYMITPTGKNLKQLTNDGAGKLNTTWAPDGIRLLYSSDVSGQTQIYVVNVTAATPAPVQITKGNFASFGPTWNCAGTQIVYSAASNGPTGTFNLFSLPASGNGQPQAVTSGNFSDTGVVIRDSGTNSGR